jgi:fucose 4-O-acetylase-like acetyltransferase
LTKDVAWHTRIEWIDVAKGLGIILVVLAHVLAGISVGGMKEPLFDLAASFINTFHMPIFLVLAGVFAPSTVKKSSTVFWVNKLEGLVYPYFVWAVIQIGIQILMTRYTNTPMTGQDFYTIFYRPPMQFWFLYGLFLDFVIYRIISTCGGSARSFFVVSLLLAMILNFCNVEDTSVFGRMRDNLPYFALGAMMSQSILRVNLVSSQILSSIVIGGLGLTAVICNLNLNLAPRLLVMLSLPILGVCSIFALSTLLVRWRLAVIFTYLGQMSLEIYLAHVLAYSGTRILLLRAFGITSTSGHLICGVVAGLGLPILLAIIAKRSKFPYLFRWSTPK